MWLKTRKGIMSNEKDIQIFSSDQGVFSQWDQVPKDAAVLRALPSGVQLNQNAHMSDILGRQSVDDAGKFSGIHVSREHYGIGPDGHEFTPAWFAVSDAMPLLTLEYMSPATLHKAFNAKVEAIVSSALAAKDKLSDNERAAVDAVLNMLHIDRLPESVNEGYLHLTEGNWMGLVDEGRRSASSYHMSEILPAQRHMMMRLYRQSMKMIAPEEKGQLQKRFKHITTEGVLFAKEMFNTSLPEASRMAFVAITHSLQEQTGIDFESVRFDESSNEYRLPRAQQLNERMDHFTFLKWYLEPEHRAIYDNAHNESGKIMTQGINPMQSQKGETPFWVIVNGERTKLYLTNTHIQLGNKQIALSEQIRTVEELSHVLYTAYGDAKISVIPTAIGYILQMRANGAHLLPEKGSSYIPQVDLVYDLMRKHARISDLNDIRPYPTLRVHPHGLSALPDGHRLRLPAYLREGFSVDTAGFTTTDQIKAEWKNVVAQREGILDKARNAKTLQEKADVLFADSEAYSFIRDLFQQADQYASSQTDIKRARSELMAAIRQTVRNNNNILRAVGEYMAGKKDDANEIEGLSGDLKQEAQRLRDISLSQGSSEHLYAILTYLTALQFRQLAGGVEALKYFDVRPSLMTMYLMFGEDGVNNLINTSEVYLEMLGGEKQPLRKEVTVVNGNRLLFVDDRDKRIFTVNSLKRFNEEQALRLQLIASNADSAIILTRSDNGDTVQMLVLEKDGSYSEFCGNAARHVVHMYCDKGITIETISGHTIHGMKKDGYVALDMPIVSQEMDEKQSNILAEILGNTTHYKLFTAAGEPHLVIDIRGQELDADAFAYAGRQIQNVFDRGVNVDFVMDEEVAVFERGANDFTGSCGTGASSIANYLNLTGENHIQFVHPRTLERQTLTVVKEGEKTFLKV